MWWQPGLIATADEAWRAPPQGVPPPLRRRVWLELSGANQRRGRLPPHYYASSALQGAESPFAHQIDLVSLGSKPSAGRQAVWCGVVRCGALW